MTRKKKPSKSHHLPDKKNAPKRTGQRGIKPPFDRDDDEFTPSRTEELLQSPENAEVKAFIEGAKLTREEKAAKKQQALLEVPKSARQKELPGMEERHIQEIEEVAVRYAEIRDQRQALTRREVDAKELLLNVMKRHNKRSYVVDEMAIEIVITKEKIRVKLKKGDDGDSD